jgi:hypothetical protein
MGPSSAFIRSDFSLPIAAKLAVALDHQSMTYNLIVIRVALNRL